MNCAWRNGWKEKGRNHYAPTLIYHVVKNILHVFVIFNLV